MGHGSSKSYHKTNRTSKSTTYNIYSSQVVTEYYVSNNKLLENGIGLEYELNKRLSLIFEHHQLDSFNAYDFINIFKNDNPDIRSDHIGFYYKFNNDFNNKSFIDFSFKMGVKSTEYNAFEDEKYYSIMISLLGGEKWFINERNK